MTFNLVCAAIGRGFALSFGLMTVILNAEGIMKFGLAAIALGLASISFELAESRGQKES